MRGGECSRDDLVRRGETMSRLKEQQCSLNMRLRLAMQNHDTAAQVELEAQLCTLEEQIRCLGSCVRTK